MIKKKIEKFRKYHFIDSRKSPSFRPRHGEISTSAALFPESLWAHGCFIDTGPSADDGLCDRGDEWDEGVSESLI